MSGGEPLEGREAPGSAETPPGTGTARTRRGLRWAAIAVVAVITLTGAALVGTGIWSSVQGETDQNASERRAVEPLGGQRLAPTAAPPLSIRIPALDFSAPIEPLATDSETTLDPPTAEDAYWLSDYGLAGEGAENTFYLIGHTSADGRAVFDPLVDRGAGEVTVMPGDEILVDTSNGTAVYEIIATERHDKTALADLENVWTNAPGRLVIITCFFGADGTAPDNMVLFARLNGGA